MHSDLIAKLEALDGPDREVDWLIADHFNEIPDHHVRETGWDYTWWRGPGEWSLWKATDSEGRNVELWQPQPVTASLDAAVALVERVLPGWDWGVNDLGEDGCEGKVWKHGWHDDTVIRAGHKSSPAVALLIAALKALEARDG